MSTCIKKKYIYFFLIKRKRKRRKKNKKNKKMKQISNKSFIDDALFHLQDILHSYYYYELI
jgi:hypothetical protein